VLSLDGRGVCVAFSGQPWRLWRYGKTKRHGRKSYSMRLRAFVAFVAFFFGLGLAIKKKRDDTLHPRPTLSQPDRGPRITPLTPQTPCSAQDKGFSRGVMQAENATAAAHNATVDRAGIPIPPAGCDRRDPMLHPAADDLDP